MTEVVKGMPLALGINTVPIPPSFTPISAHVVANVLKLFGTATATEGYSSSLTVQVATENDAIVANAVFLATVLDPATTHSQITTPRPLHVFYVSA